MYDADVTPDGQVGAGFDEYTFYLLTQLINRRNRDFAPALGAVGLSLAEWRALSVVKRLDGCLMSELSDFTTVDRTTLTRTVDHLVAEGLVARRAAVEDRRQVVVELAPRGSAILAQAVEALKDHNRRALNGLSEGDLQTLRGLLQRVLRNLIDDPDHFHQILRFER